jgi:hypothetical protein
LLPSKYLLHLPVVAAKIHAVAAVKIPAVAAKIHAVAAVKIPAAAAKISAFVDGHRSTYYLLPTAAEKIPIDTI